MIVEILTKKIKHLYNGHQTIPQRSLLAERLLSQHWLTVRHHDMDKQTGSKQLLWQNIIYAKIQYRALFQVIVYRHFPILKLTPY